MPVTLGPHEPGEGTPRIEIIPLIDIMFFLLAAFMMVSLSLTHLQSVPVQLPRAASAEPGPRPDLFHLVVDRNGMVWWENRVYGPAELAATLAERLQSSPGTRVAISADADTRHAHVVQVLDLLRSLGIHQVSLHVDPAARP